MANITLILFHITEIFVGVICIVGNALVCHIIVRVKSMKTSMNYVILNLAILDAITGFFAIFFVMTNDNKGVLGTPMLKQAYNESNTLPEVFCKIESAYWFGGVVSPLLLTAMAFERYKAIVHPLSVHGGGTKARLRWILPLSWFVGLVFYIVDILDANYNSKDGICTVKIYPWLSRKAYFLVYATVLYIIPSIAMIIFYSRAITALRRPVEVAANQMETHRTRTKARKRVLKVAILVTCIFYVFCGTPHTLYGLNEFFGFFAAVSFDVLRGSIALSISFNSAINPFIYFLLIKSFRDGFFRVFRGEQEHTTFKFSSVLFCRRSGSVGLDH